VLQERMPGGRVESVWLRIGVEFFLIFRVLIVYLKGILKSNSKQIFKGNFKKEYLKGK
jgi:hypothetical protein